MTYTRVHMHIECTVGPRVEKRPPHNPEHCQAKHPVCPLKALYCLLSYCLLMHILDLNKRFKKKKRVEGCLMFQDCCVLRFYITAHHTSHTAVYKHEQWSRAVCLQRGICSAAAGVLLSSSISSVVYPHKYTQKTLTKWIIMITKELPALQCRSIRSSFSIILQYTFNLSHSQRNNYNQFINHLWQILSLNH